MSTPRVSIIALCAMALGATAFAQAPTAATPEHRTARSLYDRLGGVYAIAAVVDDFIERLLVNDTLNANPAIKAARERVPKAGLKFQVTTLVCQVTGGPCQYAGRSMKAAPAHLDLRAAEWDAMVADFRKTLDKFEVPAAEQGELITIVGSTRPDIVVAPSAPAR